MKNGGLLGFLGKLFSDRSKVKTIASIVILALDHIDDIVDLFNKDKINPREVVKNSAEKQIDKELILEH